MTTIAPIPKPPLPSQPLAAKPALLQPAAPAAAAPKPVTLGGFNVMLLGPAGTGKTFSIASLVATGLEVFYLDLDNSLEALIGAFTDRGQPVPANLHWHTVEPPDANFDTALDRANKINTLSMKALADMVDPNRMKHNQFNKILAALANFTCHRTGQSFGAVDKWDTSRVIVIDGLTGVSNAAMSMVVGNKPVKSQGDWGLAMDQVYQLVFQLAQNCRCHYVQIAHVERELDPTFGGSKIMVSTLGNKLAPKLPQLFSDIVLCVRNGDKWHWDTANPQADLKTRNLAVASNLDPSFAAIHARWAARTAGLSGTSL